MPTAPFADTASQGIPARYEQVYGFVPKQERTQRWTDADLYAMHGLTDDEIGFIEKVVRPMDLDADE